MKKRLIVLLLVAVCIVTTVLADEEKWYEDDWYEDGEEWYSDLPQHEWEDGYDDWSDSYDDDEKEYDGSRFYDDQDYKGSPRDMMFREDDEYGMSGPPDEFIDDPESYMQYCHDPELMVDLLIQEMERNGAFEEMLKQCDDMKEEVDRCYHEDHCEEIKEHHDDFFCETPSFDELFNECMEPIYHDAESMQEDIDDLQQDEEQDEFFDDMIKQMEDDIDDMIDHGKETCEQYSKEDMDMMEEQCEQEQEKMEEYQERDYERCREEQEYHCSRMEEAVEQCESNMNRGDMKHEMIEEGKRICEMYDKHKNFMDIMQMVEGDHRDTMGMEMRRIAKAEESLKRVEHDEDKSFFRKVMEFLGFAKEEIIQDATDLREAAQELEASITTLQELQASVDPTTAEALEQEIQRLHHEKEKLYEQAEKYENRASGFMVMVGSSMKDRKQ